MIKGAFNTGRKYTASGQRIGWYYDTAARKVVFSDFDRMIGGEFAWPEGFGDIEPTNHDVQSAYDRNAYRMSCDAMMMRLEEYFA